MIKLIGLSALALGFVLHFVEWLYDFKLNGWSFATVLSVAVLIERIHHDHQTRFMLKIIGSKVGVEWQSYLQENGLKHIYPKLLKYSTKPKGKKEKKMKLLLNNPWSKKLFAFLLLIAVNGLNDVLGLHLTPDTIGRITTLGGTYIVAQAGVDAIKPIILYVVGLIESKTVTTTTTTAKSDPNQFIQG